MEAIPARHLSDLLPDDPERAALLVAHFAFLLEGAMVRAGLEGTGARDIAARAIVTDMLKTL